MSEGIIPPEIANQYSQSEPEKPPLLLTGPVDPDFAKSKPDLDTAQNTPHKTLEELAQTPIQENTQDAVFVADTRANHTEDIADGEFTFDDEPANTPPTREVPPPITVDIPPPPQSSPTEENTEHIPTPTRQQVIDQAAQYLKNFNKERIAKGKTQLTPAEAIQAIQEVLQKYNAKTGNPDGDIGFQLDTNLYQTIWGNTEQAKPKQKKPKREGWYQEPPRSEDRTSESFKDSSFWFKYTKNTPIEDFIRMHYKPTNYFSPSYFEPVNFSDFITAYKQAKAREKIIFDPAVVALQKTFSTVEQTLNKLFLRDKYKEQPSLLQQYAKRLREYREERANAKAAQAKNEAPVV